MKKYRIVENVLGEFRVEERWLFGWLPQSYWSDQNYAQNYYYERLKESQRETVRRVVK